MEKIVHYVKEIIKGRMAIECLKGELLERLRDYFN